MKSIGSFFQEVKNELSKIVWPTREAFLGATVVVLFVVLVFTIFLGVLNQIFHTSATKGFYWLVFGR
jgi:preprotein translocase subunit SecE